VTIVASTLQKAGLITYHRGQLTIVDGDGLEAASCECYRATTDLMNAVMKRASPKRGCLLGARTQAAPSACIASNPPVLSVLNRTGFLD
jgi:hypothetical protein